MRGCAKLGGGLAGLGQACPCFVHVSGAFRARVRTLEVSAKKIGNSVRTHDTRGALQSRCLQYWILIAMHALPRKTTTYGGMVGSPCMSHMRRVAPKRGVWVLPEEDIHVDQRVRLTIRMPYIPPILREPVNLPYSSNP